MTLETSAILARFRSGDLPANVALMQIAIASLSQEAFLAGLESELELRELAALHPGAFATVKAVMAEADHAQEGTGPEHWQRVFDRLAQIDPDAASALYGLGSPDLLRRATDEVVQTIQAWDLTGPDKRLLEIGCGSGRFSLALAPLFDGVLGLDISSRMVVAAQARAREVPNASFARSSGRDLRPLPEDSFDLVLAADLFPYLVTAEDGLAETHISEAARVLTPDGALLILNYSYRGDAARDLAEVKAHFAAAGLVLERAERLRLTTWDAWAFLGRKR